MGNKPGGGTKKATAEAAREGPIVAPTSQPHARPHARPPIGTYLDAPACPFARHFPQQPENFDAWGTALIEKFEAGWTKDGCPTGPGHNDHLWTPLGAGNTCGLVHARLEIGHDRDHLLTQLAPDQRVGLFQEERTCFPCILRFSDFGPDDDPKTRLLRMAVKMPFNDSWCGEINLLTTATLEAFVLADGAATQVCVCCVCCVCAVCAMCAVCAVCAMQCVLLVRVCYVLCAA